MSALHSLRGTVEIADHVRRIAQQDPGRIALIHVTRRPGGRLHEARHTYRELSDRAERLAVGLRRIGIVEGTRCSFMVPPGIDAMVAGIALWRVGAVVVGIEPHSHGLGRVARCLAQVEPEAFIGTPRAHAARLAFGWGKGSVRTLVLAGGIGLPGIPTLRSLERGPVPDEPLQGAVRPEDPAVIAFTTGSTGRPKPTLLRQRNLAAMLSLLVGHWGLTDTGDEVVDMVTFPMFWIIGVAVGGTVVVPPMDFTMKGPADADPELLLATIERCGVTSMFGSPALLTNLARRAASSGRAPLGLRRVIAGGAEVPGELFAQMRAVLGADGELYSDYGATEALPVAEIAGAEVLADTWAHTEQGAGVCVGHPLPGVEVAIVAIDDDPIPTWDDATPLATGEIGEVVARSPHISEEYVGLPDTTAENKIAAPDGAWHRIGDTGYLDRHGRLWVCGRRSHRVETPGGVVFPLCVEPVANAHPAVVRSALVGVPGPSGTAEAVLAVELDPDATGSADAVGELRAQLAAVPGGRLVGRIEVLDRIPVDRRHNAKIDRPRIAAGLSSTPG